MKSFLCFVSCILFAVSLVMFGAVGAPWQWIMFGAIVLGAAASFMKT